MKHYLYLGTPYSRFAGGIEAAFVMACNAAADLMRLGIPVFSPIAHSHPIAIHGGIDPMNHAIWLPADEPMMHAAAGMIVWRAEGWESSRGIFHEMDVFMAAGKSVIPVLPGEFDKDTLYLMRKLCAGEGEG